MTAPKPIPAALLAWDAAVAAWRTLQLVNRHSNMVTLRRALAVANLTGGDCQTHYGLASPWVVAHGGSR